MLLYGLLINVKIKPLSLNSTLASGPLSSTAAVHFSILCLMDYMESKKKKREREETGRKGERKASPRPTEERREMRYKFICLERRKKEPRSAYKAT